MLVEYYIAALTADERAADEIWELWGVGLISDDLTALSWWLVAAGTSEAIGSTDDGAEQS